jgi:hypothetical protein
MGLSSADTELSVRREIAAAEKARARALEALEHAVFVDKVSKDEERYFKDALERANAKQFQARIKLSSLGLRKNSRKRTSLRRNAPVLRHRVVSVYGDIANIAATMENRLTYATRNNTPDEWLRTALLEETRRLDTAAKHMRRLLER